VPVTFPFEPTALDAGDIFQQTHTWRDAKGFTALTRYYVAGNGANLADTQTFVSGILTALKALSNAAYQGSNGLVDEYGVKQYGTAAAYGSVRMKARLALQDSQGGIHSLNIPAAKIAVFDNDMQTVKPSAVAALIAIITNDSVTFGDANPFVATRGGYPLTNLMGGFFVARQTRKNKLFILDAQLTASEPGD